jgi:hypothetical protein
MMIGDEAYAIMAQRQREANAYRASKQVAQSRYERQVRQARQVRQQQLVSLRIRRLLITVARQDL